MRIYFIGTVVFSKIMLEKLIAENSNIIGVTCKSSSSFNSDYVDLAPICIKNNIPYYYANDINSEESINSIKNAKPDIIFCLGWSELLEKKLLSIPVMGVLGYHPAALPKNRGRHPLIWALVLGLKQTASTFFFMNEKADAGEIVSQEIIDIDYHDCAMSLYQKFTETALIQIEQFLPQLQNNTFTLQKQDLSLSNKWRKRFGIDGQLDFRMSSYAIYNLVRALSKPYVGAHILHKGKEIKVWKAKEYLFTEDNIEPGKVLKIQGHHIIVKTYQGAIELCEHEFETLPNPGTYL